jgi:hypothetical protein
MKKRTEKKLSLGKLKIASLTSSKQAALQGGFIRTIDTACQGNTTPISICPCISTGPGGCSDPC